MLFAVKLTVLNMDPNQAVDWMILHFAELYQAESLQGSGTVCKGNV